MLLLLLPMIMMMIIIIFLCLYFDISFRFSYFRLSSFNFYLNWRLTFKRNKHTLKWNTHINAFTISNTLELDSYQCGICHFYQNGLWYTDEPFTIERASKSYWFQIYQTGVVSVSLWAQNTRTYRKSSEGHGRACDPTRPIKLWPFSYDRFVKSFRYVLVKIYTTENQTTKHAETMEWERRRTHRKNTSLFRWIFSFNCDENEMHTLVVHLGLVRSLIFMNQSSQARK